MLSVYLLTLLGLVILVSFFVFASADDNYFYKYTSGYIEPFNYSAYGQIGTDPSDPSSFNGGLIDGSGNLIHPPQNTNPSGKGYNDLNGPNGPEPNPHFGGDNGYIPENLDNNGDGEITPADSYAGGPSIVPPWLKNLFNMLKDFFDGDSGSKGGDPLYININGTMGQRTVHEEWYDYDGQNYPFSTPLMYLDLDCDGKAEKLDRNIEGTWVLFMDIYDDGKITCGAEIMYGGNVYETLRLFDDKAPFLRLDSNDTLFHKFKINNFTHTINLGEDDYIDLRYAPIPGDYLCNGGCGAYTDGMNGYVKDWLYKEQVRQHGFFANKYSEQHVRADNFNEYGAYINGVMYPTFSGIIGYWR